MCTVFVEGKKYLVRVSATRKYIVLKFHAAWVYI